MTVGEVAPCLFDPTEANLNNSVIYPEVESLVPGFRDAGDGYCHSHVELATATSVQDCFTHTQNDGRCSSQLRFSYGRGSNQGRCLCETADDCSQIDGVELQADGYDRWRQVVEVSGPSAQGTGISTATCPSGFVVVRCEYTGFPSFLEDGFTATETTCNSLNDDTNPRTRTARAICERGNPSTVLIVDSGVNYLEGQVVDVTCPSSHPSATGCLCFTESAGTTPQNTGVDYCTVTTFLPSSSSACSQFIGPAGAGEAGEGARISAICSST